MASRLSTEPQSRAELPRPEPGQILLVIHDFSSRSPDELSLARGDRVELIERDDDFGDGWYFGRHLTNGNSGLFPQVYTRVAPREPPSFPLPAPHQSTGAARTQIANVENSAMEQPKPAVVHVPQLSPPTIESRMSVPTADIDRTPQASRHVSASESVDHKTHTSPLATTAQNTQKFPPPPIITNTDTPLRPKSLIAAKSHAHGQDSPVMNETLSVIDEHITDMNAPMSTLATSEQRSARDSGSEYSSHRDHRLSYINGEETDEEEDGIHTRDEVERWTPDQVAEYLFTAGVEPHHCEVFRDQEITGDVLLGMDQTSVFLKEFDLGSVGRRLKTWQKIKSLQEMVNGDVSSRRNTTTYGSEVSSEGVGLNGNKINAMTRTTPTFDRPGSQQNGRFSSQYSARPNLHEELSPVSPSSVQDVSRPTTEKRPSAASIRDLHHSRRNSVNDYGVSYAGNDGTASLAGTLAGAAARPPLKTNETTHKKQPSFDKNWTMGSAASPSLGTRPHSSRGARNSPEQISDTSPANAFDPLDRGYFSGGEADGRSRNVLRKRGSSDRHSRHSSYTEEQRIRTATATSKHSRFGSVDSLRGGTPPSAAQKYYGLAVQTTRRTPSESSINAPPRPMPPPKDVASPTVTRLDGNPYENVISPLSPSQGSGWLSPVKSSPATRHFGLRAISDAVTGHEKARVTSPTDSLHSTMKDSPIQSPSRAGSSTPSAGPSFEMDSPDAKSSSILTTPGSTRTNRKKTKKETSAYTRGLEKKSPREQMIGADYSGWMKKKSTNLMTTWKPRLFILKGRRLSYYYSENDTEEKGLIDISFHRVLPADTDRLTGLHATLTGATTSPTSPANAQTQTIASADAAAAAADPESTLSKSSGDSIFIFKLVPPRAGLSRAVTFTKPTVHYFAVPSIKQGRLWMAALMKATIDRDDSKAITTTYQQKTISLAKARAMRHRPPALMNLDEHVDEEAMKTPASDKAGLNISGIIFNNEIAERDSGVEGLEKDEIDKVANGKMDGAAPKTA